MLYIITIILLSGDSSSSLSATSTSTTTVTTAAKQVGRADQSDGSSAKTTTPMLTAPTASDEKRLEEIFSRTFQQEQEELTSKNYRPKDTLTEKVKALTEAKGMDKRNETKEEKEEKEEEEGEYEMPYTFAGNFRGKIFSREFRSFVLIDESFLRDNWRQKKSNFLHNLSSTPNCLPLYTYSCFLEVLGDGLRWRQLVRLVSLNKA